MTSKAERRRREYAATFHDRRYRASQTDAEWAQNNEQRQTAAAKMTLHKRQRDLWLASITALDEAALKKSKLVGAGR